MSSKFRYRGGNVQYVALPTANDGVAAHAIEIGDLVYVAGGVAYSAAHLADAGSAAVNRAAFALAFAGVAVQKIGKQTGESIYKPDAAIDPGWILVATSGDYEFDCATGISWTPGAKVGVYNDATTNSNQAVCLVTENLESIGVAKVPFTSLGSTTLTSIVVGIRSTLMHENIGSGQ